MLCVLKADVHGFGLLMAADSDGPVRKALNDAVQRWAPPGAAGCCRVPPGAIREAGNGDSVLMVCDDPVALAQTGRPRAT